MALKYDWIKPILRLETTPQPYPARQCLSVASMATWFVSAWADWAERARMQPAHLLKYDLSDQAGRGLAWRWEPGMDVLCFPRDRYLMAEMESGIMSPLYFIYRFDPDGRTVMVTGDERRDILGSLPDLIQKPPLREAYLG